mgnify:CR=1 FL=1
MKSETIGALVIGLIIIITAVHYWVQSDKMMRATDYQVSK